MQTRKKSLALTLAATLLLLLAACGGGDAGTASTKEELLAMAQELKPSDVLDAWEENKLRAEETYLNHIYSFAACVTGIETEYCQMDGFRVYLPKEDLMNLNKGEMIQVVGTITKIDGGVELHNAYYVDNIVAIEGVVHIDHTYITYQNEKGKYVEYGDINELYCYIKDDNGKTYKIADEALSNRSFTSVDIAGTTVNKGDTILALGKVYSDQGKSYYSHGTGSKAISFTYRIEDITLDLPTP